MKDGKAQIARLRAPNNDKPVKVTVELPATVHRISSSTRILARESSRPISDPVTLTAPMLARFMAADRAFAKTRHAREQSKTKDG